MTRLGKSTLGGKRMKRSFIKKCRSKRGDTLAEVLIATLIAVLALTMLPGAIVAAAKMNRTVEEKSISVNSRLTNTNVGKMDIQFGLDEGSMKQFTSADVILYGEEDNGFYRLK